MDRLMRITMVGASGSGKTSFLSGVYQTMVDDDVNGLRFVPRGSIAKQMQGIGKLSEVSIVENNLDFAAGTARTTNYPLSLYQNSKRICDFEFIDYRGGAIDDMFAESTGNDDASAVREYIRTSDAVIVFADSVLLNYYTNLQQCRVATRANRINKIFELLSDHFVKKNLSILLALTKADDSTLSPINEANNYAGLIEKGLNVYKGVYECVKMHQKDCWSFGVIPVSAVGKNVAKTEEFPTHNPSIPIGFKSTVKSGCFPKPFNVDVAMVYSICCVLKAWEDDFIQMQNQVQEKLIDAQAINTIWHNFLATIYSTERPKDIVTNTLKIAEGYGREIMTLRRDMGSIVKAIQPYQHVVRRIDGFPVY